MARELGEELIPLEAVRAEILSLLPLLPAERCRLEEGWNRVLREDLTAPRPVPPFDNSAMDGYAVRVEDLAGATKEGAVRLRLAGSVPAGAGEAKSLEPGGTIRIMTGAPLPRGTGAVVPHELTRREGDLVFFTESVRAGANLRRAGSDLAAGSRALRSGERLRGPQLSIAAALGRAELRASRPPRVAILSPGDELVAPGGTLGPGQIHSSNSYGLAGFLREIGAEPIHLGIVPDRPELIRAALERARAAGADALVTTGGVSAGDRDHVQEIAREDGRPGRVYKVAMRPGKPLAFAILSGVPLFGLPGNPASAMVSFIAFVRPALRRMMGEEEILPGRFPVRFAAPFPYRPGRTFLLRARVAADHGRGGFIVLEPGNQDSSALSSLARANAIVELPAELPGGREEAVAGEVFEAEWIHV